MPRIILIVAAMFLLACETGEPLRQSIVCYAGDGKVIFQAEDVITYEREGGFMVYFRDGHIAWVRGTCVVQQMRKPAESPKGGK